MSVSIIQAKLEHLDLVAPLFDAYRVFYSQRSDPNAARIFIQERLANQDAVVLLAVDEQSQTGLGFAQLYPSFSSVSMKPIWILNDLFVSTNARRTGLGKQLMQAVREFASSTDAVRIDLATAADNLPAKALYEVAGYSQDKIFDHYKLPVN